MLGKGFKLLKLHLDNPKIGHKRYKLIIKQRLNNKRIQGGKKYLSGL